MCCCNECTNRAPRRGGSAEGADPTQPKQPPMCSGTCTIFNIAFYVFMLSAAAGIPLWVSGVLGYNFLDKAKDSFTMVSCNHIATIIEISHGNKGQKQENEILFFCVPADQSTDQCVADDKVYKLTSNGFSRTGPWRNIQQKQFQDNSVAGGNHIATMYTINDNNKGIEPDDWWTLETCYICSDESGANCGSVGDLDKDSNVVWDVQKGLDSNTFQNCKTAGMILTLVGLIGGIPILLMSERGCPMCIPIAGKAHAALSFSILGSGMLAAGIIGLVVNGYFYGTESNASTVGAATLAIAILLLIAAVPLFIFVCLGLQKKQKEAKAAKAAGDQGAAPPAYTEGNTEMGTV